MPRLQNSAHRLVGFVRGRKFTVWQVLLVVAMVAHTWYLTRASLRIHYSMGTGAYDFGLYDQGMWLLSRFKAPAVTLIGRNLLGDHTSFILLLLVPAYWIAPGAGTLFFLQSAALAAGAIPIFLLARRRVGREWMAFGLAAAYLANPTINLVNTEDFHPDVFLPVLIGFAVYFAVVGRWRPYTVSVVLALLVKEDVFLVVVLLGLWVALRRNRSYGLVTIGMALVYFVFAASMIHFMSGTGFPNGWRIPFGGVWGLIKTAVSRPGDLFDYLLADGRPWYLWQLAVPFAFVFLVGPEIAAIAVVVIGSNVISNFSYQHQIRYHYSAVVVGVLAMGTAYAIGRLRGKVLTAAVAGVVVCSLWAGYLWSDVGLARFPRYTQPNNDVAREAWDLVDLIPADAAISVDYRVAAHVARRESVYMFPNPFATDYYGYETNPYPPGWRLPAADTIEYVMLRSPIEDDDPTSPSSPTAVWAREQGAFELVAENADWTLWKRR
jgi:uncharacterized membrane protein